MYNEIFTAGATQDIHGSETTDFQKCDDHHDLDICYNQGRQEIEEQRVPFVEQKDTREVIDITTLNAEIAGIVARQSELRTAIDEIVADLDGGAQ